MAERCEKTGKRCLTKVEAETYINHKDNKKHKDNKLRYYHCPWCNWWHPTEQPKHEGPKQEREIINKNKFLKYLSPE